MDSATSHGRPARRIGIRLGTVLGVVGLLVVAGGCVFENEGRSGEAEKTVRDYLAAVAGADADRGWSVLSTHMRESHSTPEAYVDLAEAAGDAPLPINDIRLIYEDDGFYEFAVTTPEPIHPAYTELLFRPASLESTIGCLTGPDAFTIAVIIGAFSEFDGVTGDSCP
jgi:hypothetical protein